MAVVKLRKQDKETLEKLSSAVQKVKGETSNAEVVGYSLGFARSNIETFLQAIVENLDNEPLVQMLRNPVARRRGEKTDARKVDEYLYKHR